MRYFGLILVILISSCATVDNYLLGKDNSESPTKLQALSNKLSINILQEKKLVKTFNSDVAPQIANNVIYSASDKAIVASSKDNFTEIWTASFAHKIISGIEVHNNLLIIGTDDAKILALDAHTGKELWQTQLSTDALAKALVYNANVYLKTVAGRLYALSAKTGEIVWVNDHGSPHLILRASSAPSIFGDNLLVAFADGKVDAINLDSGETLWQKKIVYPSGASDIESLMDIDATPIIKNNIAYIASFQNYVAAMSLENGAMVWEHHISAYKDIALQNDLLFITDVKDIIWALDAKTGEVSWRQKSLKARKLTSPLIFKNYAIFADIQGFVHVLDSRTGEVLARIKLSAAITNVPLIDNGKIYVVANNGSLYKLDIE
jgi:outer membrane protein assembly factor BamB